jgi:hypothetical protein
LIRIRIAVFGLLAVAGLTIFNLLLDVPGLRFSNIEQFDQHLAQVRAALPASATVGYYSDTPTGDTALEEYYLVQYALAPVVVAKNVDQDFVVANFHNQNRTLPNKMEMVRDFGSGIALLRKLPR